MKNKETIEEASEKYANMHQDVSGKLGKYLVKAVFQDGVKWENEQDNNKYSEEEVLQLLLRLQQTESYDNLYEWFNKFKKK